MSTIKLIATSHSPEVDSNGHRRVMSSESDEDFYQRYGNTLNERDLIITEGGFWERVIGPSHRLYKERLERISKLLSVNSKIPHLLFVDYRHKIDPRLTNHYVVCMIRLQNFLNSNMLVSRPTSLEQLKDFIFNETCEIKFMNPPDHSIRAAAKNFLPISESTDKLFMDSILAYQDKYERIFLITGSTHSMYIAKELGLDFELLNSSGNASLNLQQSFGSYVVVKKLPLLAQQY